MKRISVVLASFLFFSACSSYYSSNGEERYAQAKNGPDLVVPSPLTAENISGFYNLPPQNQDPRVSIAPPQRA